MFVVRVQLKICAERIIFLVQAIIKINAKSLNVAVASACIFCHDFLCAHPPVVFYAGSP